MWTQNLVTLIQKLRFLNNSYVWFQFFYYYNVHSFVVIKCFIFYIIPLAILAKVCSTSGLDKVKPNAKILYFYKCNLQYSNNTAL